MLRREEAKGTAVRVHTPTIKQESRGQVTEGRPYDPGPLVEWGVQCS